MAKENVFVVLSHKHSLKKGSKTEWEVTETVEFVNQLRKRHHTMSSVIGDYLNEKMVAGQRFGFDEYEKFDKYIRGKYEKQMKQLDAAYKEQVSVESVPQEDTSVFVDEFGNVRAKNVFDVA